MAFYQMGTEEVSDRFVAPCFVNGLEAYDVKRGNKVVKKELIVSPRGEIYFVKFIINLEEDDVEPRVIFGRSFLGMTKAITNFGVGTVTIYPDIDPFLEEIKEEGKSNDDWDHLLDFNIDGIPLLGEQGIPPFVCKMGKSSRNKKWAMENLNFFYQDIGTSSSAEGHLTQEEALKILDEVWKDKVDLDGKIVKEEEEAVKRIKGEALKEKDDPRAFIFPIRLEGQVEAMGILQNVLCQVGVTTLIAKFLILDILIDRDSPIVVGQGFLRTISGIVNTPERLFLTFDGFCHQTFRAARSDIMRNAESDCDDEEDYQIKRNKFVAPIYGPNPASYLNCNDPDERSIYNKENRQEVIKVSQDATRAISNMDFNLVDVEGVWQVWRVRLSLLGDRGGEFALSILNVLQRFGFFLYMGFTLILATLDGLDVGLLGDVISEDDCDDNG
ncbi:hypothetical protein Tco_0560856 [Tanacetum coccineum]